MSDNSWVIPVATLCSICGVGLIFIWWWFPRMWAKGQQHEMELIAAGRAERARRAQQLAAMEATSEEGGGTGPDGQAKTTATGTGLPVPPPTYRPSAVAVF